MRPGEALREFREECRRGDRAAVPTGDVRHVREIALELLAVFFGERHVPRAIVDDRAAIHQLARELVVVREDAGVVDSERHDNGAGQRRHVDHDAGLVPFRVVQRVREHETPFGIRIQDFDGQALRARHDVAGFDRAAVGHVLAGGHEADDVQRQVELRDRVHRADHAGGARHVELHLVHERRILEGDAAGVEGDAFAHEDDRRVLRARVAVLDDEETWRLLAALGDGEEAAHLLALDLGETQHFHLQRFVCLRETFGRLAEVRRRADVAGKVGEIAHERGAVGESAALCETFLHGLRGLGRGGDDDASQRVRTRLLRALQIVDPVVRVAGQLGDRAAQAFIVEQFRRRTGQGEGQRRDAGARGGGERGQRGPAPRLARDVAASAQSHEQHAFRAHALEVGHQPGLARFAGEIPALHQAGELFTAREIQTLGFRGKFAVVMDTDGETIDRQLGERLGPGFEIHFTLALSRRAAVF